jgi:hypothetical protein
MSTKVASSGARRGGVTSFAVPEHHRDGPVNPMLVQTGNLDLEICSSGVNFPAYQSTK